MVQLSGAVYPAPGAGFPPILVVFDSEGEVVVAHTVPTIDAGKALVVTELAAAKELLRQRKL